MIRWLEKDCKIEDVIKKNEGGYVFLYGMTYWAGLFLDEINWAVDGICDKKAIYVNGKPVLSFKGVPVVSQMEMANTSLFGDGRSTIIVCVWRQNALSSIYEDLSKLDINADIVGLFDNEEYFRSRGFSFDGEDIQLFEHSYNCGYHTARMTERSVELSLARNYIDSHDDITEIGAVTPYYFEEDRIKEIIDPTDKHFGVIGKSIFDCDLNGKNVLSISTVEHIGTSDFGMNEKLNVLDALNKIFDEARSYLITAPYGYNPMLDKWVKENRGDTRIHILNRKINNEWRELRNDGEGLGEYTELWANSLVVILK